MTHENTKKSALLAFIFTFISILLNVAPMGYYILLGFMTAATSQKVILGITVVVAIILLIINLIAKAHLRSTFWVLLIGIAVCVKETAPLFIIMAISVMLDELIFAPLARRYRERTRINKEIDKRA